SKCAYREEASLAERFPVLLVNSGRDDIAYNATGPGHGAEPTLGTIGSRGRNNLRHGLAESCHKNRLSGLADLFEQGKAFSFEFRDRDLLHSLYFTMVKDYGHPMPASFCPA